MAQYFRTRFSNLLRNEQFRFLAVGGFNTVFGLVVFYTLEYFFGNIVGYFVVLLLTFAIILFTSFFLYRMLVFKTQGNLTKELFRFSSVYTIPFLANAIALPVLVSGFGWMPSIAQTVIVIFSTIFSYFGHKYFSFRKTK